VILTVCLNPAIDITYRVPRLCHGATHRVEQVRARAGGKATNVARVLRQIGLAAELIAPVGGHTGEEFLADLRSAGLPVHPVPLRQATRRSVTVFDGAVATVLNEPGPLVSPAEWSAIRAATAARLRAGDIVVLAGSAPPGCPPNAHGQLVGLAREQGARAIVDAQGGQLSAALPARPTVVKANREEVAAALGRELGSMAEVMDAAAELQGHGAVAALVSCGAEGLVAVTSEGRWRAPVPERISGNPTGAGDALTAALAAGLYHGLPWSRILLDAVTVSAAAVATAVAGEIDMATRDRLRAAARVREV